MNPRHLIPINVFNMIYYFNEKFKNGFFFITSKTMLTFRDLFPARKQKEKFVTCICKFS